MQLSGKKETNWFWPTIDHEEEAFRRAREGYKAGLILIISLILGTAATYYFNEPYLLGHDSMQSMYFGQAIQILLAAFLTWRIYTGKGRFSAIVLLLWIIAEQGLKIADRQFSVGWLGFWFVVIRVLVHSIRGSWLLRGYRRA